MSNGPDPAWRGTRSFLGALARDTRGNTLAILASALIPLAGMVGGGVDISRMYILKTRLQHACDAGALAGRRAMGGGSWSQTTNGIANYPNAQANQFFDANFKWDSNTKIGQFASFDISRSYSESAGKVTGDVKATIPMTIMRIFGRKQETMDITCDAEMRLPNTDVMFVLDTTGSMNDPQPGDTVNKMTALKTAVKCFYEIVARLDTSANCTTGTPSGGTGSQVQIRFGFVPYATNVNVGRLLNPGWFADSWKYQTREWVTTAWSAWEIYDYYGATSSTTCNNAPASTTAMQYRNYNNSKSPIYYGGAWYCAYERRAATSGQWHYAQLPVNVGLLKNGSGWKTSFQWLVNANGSAKTINWEGCVEERATVRTTTYDPIPSGAKDLNIDMTPSSGDATTQWGMVLPDVTYTRNGGSGWSTAESWSATDYGNQSYYACPVEAKKLQQWPSATLFDSYVDQMTPEGNTYHDIGLIWGARLTSPTGIFASENALTPQGGEIERHLIFMTDGDACTAPDNYTAYGVEWFERRRTSSTTAPTGGCTYNSYTMTQQVNLRTEALCTAIKNKNITLWVIAFGNLATETEDRLEACASSGRYFKATNASQLQQTFKSIADQISMLRLTK